MISHKPLPLNLLLRSMTTLTQGKTQQKSNFPLSVWLSACGQGWNSCCTWAAQPDECHPRTDLPHARVCFRPWFTLVLLTSRSQNDSWAGLAVPPIPSALQCYPRRPPHAVPLPATSLAAKRAALMLVKPLPKQCIPGEEFFNQNYLGSAILPDTIDHSEQCEDGQQWVWAGPD